MSMHISNRKKSLTVLEKAKIFREKNPRKWEERRSEIEEEVKETFGKFKDDSFLDEYYAEKEEQRKQEEKEKHLVSAEHCKNQEYEPKEAY